MRERALEAAGHLVSDRLADLVADRPVTPRLDGPEIRARLAAFDFEEPRPTLEVAHAITQLLDEGLVQSAHARCFGLFNPTPAFPGIVADMLSAAWNPQLAVWSHAPAAVEAELHVLTAVAQRLGLAVEPGSSHFTSGGSEANGAALTVALTRRFPTFGAAGAASLGAQPRVYASSESHLAWLKLLHQAGIGRQALRLVDVGADGRMDPTRLHAAIAADLDAGDIPALVVATAGTTNAGAIDPLGPIAELAEAVGAHFHVDAAWAGAAGFSPALAPALAGIECADSVTVDAHKWFSAPMGAGMFFCRRKAWLTDAYHVATDYMPKGAPADDFYTQSQQWSRRFIGLRLFMILAALGREGVAAQINHQAAMGDLLKRRLGESGWRVINDTPLPVACFVDVGGAEPEAVMRRVVDTGQAWISTTRTTGHACLRACITSFLTTEDDLEALVTALDQARKARR
ncbi:pyridoxal phosphate-dependent decarboxylase family protein [Phenylobacterium sp.]|uniref:pyridoxal phosphate-dependent decarboxylase family protein n=1 Tax=Phenylobacterium sp. TaxID=1871053 RepID=UPI002F3F84A4